MSFLKENSKRVGALWDLSSAVALLSSALGGAWLFLVVAVNLHVLRNLTDAYFILVSLAVLFAAVQFFAHKKKPKISIGLIVVFFLWLYACAMTVFTSIAWSAPLGDPYVGILRLSFSLPILLILISNCSYVDARKVFSISLFFGFLAALSLMYQYAFGAITWLAEPGERSGLVRYATTLGSLTAFGGVAGVYILLTAYLFRERNSVFFVFFVMTVFLVAALLSLQKAAIVSVLLGFVLALRLGLLSSRSFSVIFVGVALLGVAFSWYADDELVAGLRSFMENVFNTGDPSRYSDNTLAGSVVERFGSLPARVFEYWGENLLLGVGAYGASGGLGYPDLPHPHNLVVEVVAVFGFVGGVLLCYLGYLFVYSVWNLFGSNNKPLQSRLGMGIYIAVITPAMFSGGVLYHPVSGVLVILAIKLICEGNTSASFGIR